MSHAVYYGQLIIGPAGSGKSTYCATIQEMGQILRRTIRVVNLDPACEKFDYKCDLDIRDLISVDDVMEELNLGPNGGLVYCLEYLMENFEWLNEALMEFGNDDYVLFDLPGQIELYCHLDIINSLVQKLQNIGFALCSVYLIDVTFLSDERKFISGVVSAISAMINIGLPHLTVLSKCDLIQDKSLIKKFIRDKEGEEMLESELVMQEEYEQDLLEKSKIEYQQYNLTKQLKEIVISHGSTGIHQLDLNNEDSIKKIIYDADACIQYGEALEPNDNIYNKQDEYLDE